MDEPDVEYIEGLSPSIAIEQRSASRNPRSTVATSTEIYDYLRVLFARVGTPYCYQCGRPISALSVTQMVDQVMGLDPGRRITILAPVVVNRKGEHAKLLERLRSEGYSRIRLNGEVIELEELPVIDKNKRNTIEAVVDRLVIKPDLGDTSRRLPGTGPEAGRRGSAGGGGGRRRTAVLGALCLRSLRHFSFSLNLRPGCFPSTVKPEPKPIIM